MINKATCVIYDHPRLGRTVLSQTLFTSSMTLANLKKHKANTMSKPRLNINWEPQPWGTHNNMQLARALGCSGTLVKNHRAQQAPDTKTPRGRSAVDLSGADFTQHNIDIAEAFGCDPSTVRQWRLDHDVPASTAPRRPGSGRPVKYDHSRFRPSRSASDNARDMGCSYQLAWWLLKQHKQKGTK